MAGKRPGRVAIDRQSSDSRKWRASAKARRRSTTRSYLSEETSDPNALQVLLEPALTPFVDELEEIERANHRVRVILTMTDDNHWSGERLAGRRELLPGLFR